MSVRGAAIWSVASQYVAFALHFAVSVVIARFFLSPEEVGLFSIALSAAMVASILQDFGITRYVAGQPNLDEEQIRACYSVSILFALGIGLLILALAWPVASFYEDPRLLPVLLVVALSYLIVPFGIVPSALLQRKLDFRSIFIVTVGAAFANAAVALGLAASGYSALSLAWAAVAQQAVRALLGLWRSGTRPSLRLTLSGTKPVLQFGSGASLLYVSGAIGTRAPELIIGRLLSIAAVGFYGRATGLATQLAYLVTGAIGGVFYPAFARIRDRGEDMAGPYLRVVAAYGAVTWPAMAFLAAASVPVVHFLFGPAWAPVAPLLTWIALSEFAFTALPLHMEIPILSGRMRRLLQLNILDTILSVGLLVLGATWSLEGAAMSRLAYGVFWFALYAHLMRSLIGFRWQAMIGIYSKSLVATAATVAPLLFLYASGVAPSDTGFLQLASCALAGSVLWFGAIVAVRHPVREEVAGLIGTTLSMVPRRLGLNRR